MSAAPRSRCGGDGLELTSLFAVFRGTADWFGVSKDGDSTQRWQRKSLRHCSLRYGKLKPQVLREMDLPSQDNISLTSTETPPPLYVPSSQHGMQKVKKLKNKFKKSSSWIPIKIPNVEKPLRSR